MRFFSASWLSLDDEAEAQRVVREYQVFLSGLSGTVGQKIRDVTNAYSMHDSLLDRLVVDQHRGVIQFDIVAGDNQAGYSLLSLRYADACLVASAIEELSGTLDSRSSVVRYDEFDIVEDSVSSVKYIHRILLWPPARKEFGIQFADFELTATPMKRRCYETYGETFVLIS